MSRLVVSSYCGMVAQSMAEDLFVRLASEVKKGRGG